MDRSKRAIGYIRVSTEEQSKEGLSLGNQAAKIRGYVEVEGLDLIKIVEDAGKSGKDLNREGIQEVIRLCKARKVKHIIVYKFDRLTRRTIDLLWLVERVFTFNKVEFHSITEKVDTSTALGNFFLTITGAFAQMERDLISERTRDALRYKRERGEFIGSPPLGYYAYDKDLLVNQAEMDIIKAIGLLNNEPLQTVADLLNSRGFKGKRGGTFYPSTIAYIRKNKLYSSIFK